MHYAPYYGPVLLSGRLSSNTTVGELLVIELLEQNTYCVTEGTIVSYCVPKYFQESDFEDRNDAALTLFSRSPTQNPSPLLDTE